MPDKPKVVHSSHHVCPGCDGDKFYDGRSRADREQTGGYRYECVGCGWKGFGLTMKMKKQPRPMQELAEQMMETAALSFDGALEGQTDGLTNEAKQAVKEARDAQLRKG